jgi:hypothetical protein
MLRAAHLGLGLRAATLPTVAQEPDVDRAGRQVAVSGGWSAKKAG